MTDLKNRTALVAGSMSGIGRDTAIALAARGAHLLVSRRDAHFGLLDGLPTPDDLRESE